MARILLIRHCETTGQSMYSELTECGRQQAMELASRLVPYGIDRIVCSPYQRALDTIRPFAYAACLSIEIDARLAERRLAGHFFDDRDEWLKAMRRAFEEPSYSFEGGETGVEAQERGMAALREALAAANATTALVSHGQLIAQVLGRIDPSFGYEGWLLMTTPDVFLVEQRDGKLRFDRVWS
jgi:2,3-bisphosphoglycerate-dependent phosphoglycerate mutase